MGSVSRSFHTARRLAIRFGGTVTLDDLESQNGSSGPSYRIAAENAAQDIEGKEPRIVEARIQGALAHYSSKDKNETQKVVTIGFYSEKGTRIGSGHIREDGTYNFQLSRAGRK